MKLKLPWVSRRAYEFAVDVLKTSDRNHVMEVQRLEGAIRKLEAELEKERDANRNLMASALALRNIQDPYHPRNLTSPPKPIGRRQAVAAIRELEEADRKAAQEVRNAARNDADTADAPAN